MTSKTRLIINKVGVNKNLFSEAGLCFLNNRLCVNNIPLLAFSNLFKPSSMEGYISRSHCYAWVCYKIEDMNFLGSNQFTFSKIWIQTTHSKITVDAIYSQNTVLPVSVSEIRLTKFTRQHCFRDRCVHSINIHGKRWGFFSRWCEIVTSQCFLPSFSS